MNATAGEASLEALRQAGEANLRDKVLIDISNPLDFSKGMPPTLTVSNTDSLGEQIQRAFPQAKVVKTLNTVNAFVQAGPGQLARADHTIFLSGSDAGAKARAADLLRSYGWTDILDLGDITTAGDGDVPAAVAAAVGRHRGADVQRQGHSLGGAPVEPTAPLGRSSLHVPRLGVGAMTWGDPKGLARWSPAKLAYGGAHGYEEEKRAFEASVAAGVTLFDTAALYSWGASERQLGDLARDRDVLIATKFPSSFFSRAQSMPKDLAASLERLGRRSVDLYQHHFPSSRVSITQLMGLMADAVEVGTIKTVGGPPSLC